MTSSAKSLSIWQHWPLGVILGCFGFLAAGYAPYAPVRAMVAVVSAGLAFHQWAIYRRRSGRLRLSGPIVLLLTVLTISAWLAFSVIRYYTYGLQSATATRIFDLVVRAQQVLMWAVVAAVFVLSFWAIIYLARCISRMAPSR